LTRLGLAVVFLPFRENGKALHIQGFMRRFRRVVEKNTAFLTHVAQLGLPIVGIEPALTLTYRDEYRRALAPAGAGHDHDTPPPFRVQLLQEFLAEKLPTLVAGRPPASGDKRVLSLFGHCTERTEAVKSQEQWLRVFRAFGVELSPKVTGCCGMCGAFGHEAEHYEESRGVFEMSWGKQLPKDPDAQRQVVAVGHSCRSQVKRFAGFVPRHPIEALRDVLAEEAPVLAQAAE
jgi:Fe-S oxidoreductase